MSHRDDRRRCRAGSDWVVQALEGRVLLSQAGQSAPAPISAPAEVGRAQHLVSTKTSLQASTQTKNAHTTVTLVASVNEARSHRVVANGRVRFSVVAPAPDFLGTAHPNRLGRATLRTSRLSLGGTYLVEAQYLSPHGSFAPSSDRLDVEVGEPLVTSFRITAPQYFGSPGTPITFSVTALDHARQPVTGYTGTFQMHSPTDRTAKFLTRTYTFTTIDHGTHAFPDGVTFHKGGAEMIKVRQVNNTRIHGSQVFGIE